MKLFKHFLFAKWIFNKPRKKDILIYDKQSEKNIYLIFNKKDCETMHIRYESINLYIIFLTLLKHGILNFKNNYILNYIKTVSPKAVIATFNWNTAFYKLKDIYDKAIYISLIMTNVDNKFRNECKKYYSNEKNKRLKADHIFVIGKYYATMFSEVIDSNVHLLGSFRNNHYYLKKKSNINTIKSILFLSQIRLTSPIEKIKKEIIIFSSLYEYCKKKNYELIISTKNKPPSENYYRKNFIKGDWKFFPRIDLGTSYNLVNSSQLIVFTNSTLGLEALIKRIRCVSFPPEDFPVEDHGKKYSKAGPFWSCSFNYEIMEKYLDRVINYSENEWDQIVEKYIGDIMEYDPKNTRFYKIMKKLNLPILTQ